MRQRNAAGMSERLSGISEILLPDPPEGFRHIYQMYVIRVKEGQKKRDALMAYLNKKGIMAKVYFYPVHLSYFYRQKLGYTADLPATDMLSRQVLTLPMYPTLEPAEMDYIADSIKEFFPAR